MLNKKRWLKTQLHSSLKAADIVDVIALLEHIHIALLWGVELFIQQMYPFPYPLGREQNVTFTCDV